MPTVVDRTFKQTGQGYGASDVSITASIDGNVVYTGTINTTDGPLPALPDDAVNGVDLYSWIKASNFSGTLSMSIAVSGGTLLLTDTVANQSASTPLDSADPDVIRNILATTFTTPHQATVDGHVYSEPLSNVEIDGVAMTRGADPYGQWYWKVADGSTLTATITVDAGYAI